MLCSLCGAEITAPARVCPRCGAGAPDAASGTSMSKGQKTALIVVISVVAAFFLVMVLGIVAAIAIPSLLQSRKAAQSTVAIATLRNIASAQVAYASKIDNNGSYGRLTDLAAQGFLDGRFSSSPAAIDGYTYQCDSADRSQFVVTATPPDPNPAAGTTAQIPDSTQRNKGHQGHTKIVPRPATRTQTPSRHDAAGPR